jgi:hypothetical protein
MIWRGNALLIVLLLAGTSAADTVVLRNGRRIEGRVVLDNEREVTIETQTGVMMRFERKAVASVEKEAKQPAAVKETASEDLGAPEGASDDEIARLRALVPQLRDTSRRLAEASKELAEAEKAGKKDLQFHTERKKEFAKQLETLKASREAIERSAAERLAKMRRAAHAEAEQLRADTDKLKKANDAPGLADRAQKLRARVPESARDPKHGALLGEALYAMEMSGEVDQKLAADSKPENRVAGFLRAGEHFAWCLDHDPHGDERYFKRAVSAFSDAHRAAGFDTQIPERALQNLQAYRACALLVEDRLGERRWGADVAENEAGQYRIELQDRVLYGNEAPGTKEAKSARERRDRTENRSKKDEKGVTQTILVKVTRWYELLWDPKKKRWARETPATELEGKKLVPLLAEAQDRTDALARAKKDLEAAKKTLHDKLDAYVQLRKKVEAGDATEDALDKASKEVNEQKKQVELAQDGVARAQTALGVKLRELVELV